MKIMRAMRRRERGAILVLTSISMIVLMAFTAVAIDLGQRNQQLAGAQHAIDASVITAAQYLSTHDGDYAGAAARVKEIIRQNLGIEVGEWAGCDDPNHLDLSVPNDTTCISFRRIPATATTQVKNDIRVRLPHYEMSTIFGSALGIDSLDLAATAASNGNNCGSGTNQVCGPGTTLAPTTTTTEPPAPTTTTLQDYCSQYNPVYFAIDDSVWVKCKEVYPTGDIDGWRVEFCHDDRVQIAWPPGDIDWTLDGRYRFIWYWGSLCSTYGNTAARDAWFADVCFHGDVSFVYSDYSLWVECEQRRPSLVDWDVYYATTTTMPPATTAPPASTTSSIPPVTVPSSIDLSN